MFCIPFEAPIWRHYRGRNNQTYVHPDSDAALAIATALGATLGDTAVYDVQILPYCPIPDLQRIQQKHNITFADDIYNFDENYEIDYIFKNTGSNNTVVNFLIWCSTSSYSFDIKMLQGEFEITSVTPSTIAPLTYYMIDDASLTFDVDVYAAQGDLRVYKVDRQSKIATDVGYFKRISGGSMASGSPINFYSTIAADLDPLLSIPAVDYKNSGFYYMFLSGSANGTLASNTNIKQVYYINKLSNVSGLKQSNDLEVYRLCSNNFQSMFEFSPAKAKGFTGFNIDYTYLPNQPYIHVSPIMGGLYGENFNKIDDLRGLVDSSNHSIAKLSNA